MEQQDTARSVSPPRWPGAIAGVAVVLALVLVFESSGGPPTSFAPLDVPDLAAPPTTTPADDAADRTAEYPSKPAGWAQRDPGPLVSRMGQTVVWTGDRLLVWGGNTLLDDYGSGAAYAPDDGALPAWRMMARAPIQGRVAAAVWTGDRFFVFTSEAAMYDVAGDSWSSLPAPAPGSAVLSAAWTGSDVVAISRDPSSGAVIATAYGPDGTCCRPLSNPPLSLDGATALWTGDAILLVGRALSAAGPDRLELASYDPVEDVWAVHEAGPIAAGPATTAVWTGERLVAIDLDLHTAAWAADEGWHTMPDAPFTHKSCFPRVLSTNDGVFTWYCREAALLDPATGTWRDVPVPELPSHAVSTTCAIATMDDTIALWCGNGDGADPFFFEVHLDVAVAARPVVP